MAYPNIKRIGSNTEGIFSSTLDKKLPNGWAYEFSNEVYTDLEGNNYENRGIPADYKINYPLNKEEFIDELYQQIELEKDEAIELIISKI